ncbi:MAG: antibiotic biosynthesis monooxygenase [Candidatus Nanopelagicales bacterium]
MSYVVVNSLSVPADQAATLEQRFAGRAGMVEQAPGFEHFELLRPVSGTDTYLVYTRWDNVDSYQAWRDSQQFAAGHGGGRPAATGSAIWEFEVVQTA